MTQEDKELLLKDICARLPYGVKFPTKICCEATHDIIDVVRTIQSINSNGTCRTEEGDDCDFSFAWSVRPYLFPMSSMTEEQRREYDKIIYHSIELHYREYSDIVEIDLFDILQDFYCKNHLDYRGLIEKGLALDATGKGIY